MRLLVCGSRTYSDRATVYDKLDELKPDLIIHGGAKGADSLAGDWAAYNDVPQRIFLPDWELYGKSAGIRRNNQMLDTKPDLVLAFWDGASKGTAHTIEQAKKRGLQTEVVRHEPEGQPSSAN
jgi:ABC-type Fe3+-hydroxamate transport system substrate-binding protein